MSRTITKKSAVEVKAIKEPGLHWIDNNLYLNVTETGTRSWIYRFMLDGKSRAMGLGSSPTVSLASARSKVSACAEQVDKGIDPIEARRTERAEQRRSKQRITFEQGAQRYIKNHEPAWKNPRYARTWRASLRTHAFPIFGKMYAEDIKTRHVLDAVEPIWLEKPIQAKTVLGRIEAIFDALIATDDRTAANPARWIRHLEHVLPDPSLIRATKHHPWISFERGPDFIAALRKTPHLGVRPLEFLILTIMRPYEVLRARWEDIDEETRVWTAQPEDIKGRRKERDKPHRVPLCDRAIEIIVEMKQFRNGPFLFPGTKENRPLAHTIMWKAIAATGWMDVSPHGFRSTFDTWATNHTHHSPQAVQYALTHIVKAAKEIGVNPKVRKAYQHEDMLEIRRPLMEDWAVAILTGKTPGRALRPDYTGVAA